MEQGIIATKLERIHYCSNSQKGDRIDCNNYRGISLLSTSDKILWNILLSRMTPYANEIIEYQFRFRRNSLTIGHIFSIWQILKKQWEYNKEVCQLFIDFEKAYDYKKEILVRYPN